MASSPSIWADGSQAELRAANGRKEPWKVKYLGIGNETWGCGGKLHDTLPPASIVVLAL